MYCDTPFKSHTTKTDSHNYNIIMRNTNIQLGKRCTEYHLAWTANLCSISACVVVQSTQYSDKARSGVPCLLNNSVKWICVLHAPSETMGVFLSNKLETLSSLSFEWLCRKVRAHNFEQCMNWVHIYYWCHDPLTMQVNVLLTCKIGAVTVDSTTQKPLTSYTCLLNRFIAACLWKSIGIKTMGAPGGWDLPSFSVEWQYVYINKMSPYHSCATSFFHAVSNDTQQTLAQTYSH